MAANGLESGASADDFCCWGDDWSNEEGFCSVVAASNTKEAPLDSDFGSTAVEGLLLSGAFDPSLKDSAKSIHFLSNS